MEWLNRIGIILNFVAGFLLAPELIGLDRIRRFETRLEKTAARVKKVFEPYREIFIVHPVRSNRKHLYRRILGVTLILVILIGIDIPFVNDFFSELFLSIFYYLTRERKVVGILCLVLAIIIWIWAANYYLRYMKFLDETQKKLKARLILIIVAPITLPLYISLSVLLFLLRSLAFLMISVQIYMMLLPARIILYFLEGQDRLQTFFVSLGIVLFIFGNLLQLIATF
jgi:hypothetical protein